MRGHFDVIRHLVESGIPVMGHLGLLPQSVHALGGYRVQGRDAADQDLRRMVHGLGVQGLLDVPDAVALQDEAHLGLQVRLEGQVDIARREHDRAVDRLRARKGDHETSRIVRERARPAGGAPRAAGERARELHAVGDGQQLPLGWQREVSLQGGLEIFWHNGGTGGYACFVAFNRASQLGVVVLSNYGDAIAGRFDVDKIGLDLVKLGSKVSLD